MDRVDELDTEIAQMDSSWKSGYQAGKEHMLKLLRKARYDAMSEEDLANDPEARELSDLVQTMLDEVYEEGYRRGNCW